MLMKRIYLIAGLMLVGFVILSLSVWSLAFNMNSSSVAVSNAHWWLQRLPIVLGLLMIVAGFRLLGSTKVARPIDDIDYEDPAS